MEKEISFKQKTFALKENKKAQFYKEQEGARIPIIDPLEIFVSYMNSQDSLAYALPVTIKFSDKLYTAKTIKANDSIYTSLYHKVRIEFDDYGFNSQGFIDNIQEPESLWSFEDNGINF